MRFKIAHLSAALLCLIVVASPASEAALVSGGASLSARADQTVRVPAGSPLTGAPFDIPAGEEFLLSALGSFSLTWEADADNNGSVALTGFSASFNQVHPVLGPYALAAVGTGPGATFNGSLDNIIEAGGNLITADLTLNTTFSLVFTAAPGMPLIYTKDLATFTGVISGDGSIGRIFTSNAEINGDLALGGDPDSDPLAAISFGRTVTAIHEPTTFGLCSLIGLALLRRRKS